MPSPYREIARIRPVEPLRERSAVLCSARPGETTPVPRPAPFVTVLGTVATQGPASGPASLVLRSGEDSFAALWDPISGAVALGVTTGGPQPASTTHRSRLHGTLARRPAAMALTLTGTHLTLLTQEAGTWVARARHDLTGRVDVRDEAWLAGLQAGTGGSGVFTQVRAGCFGQLGLRDVRVVTTSSGEPVLEDGAVLLSATCAGPGFFDTAHTALFSLDPHSLTLRHHSDLWFRRPDRPGSFGDHAVHVVRDARTSTAAEPGAATWLVATSTWSDFHTETNPHVRATLARTAVDLTAGEHLLDTTELPLPVDGLGSVGVWDPHLLRDGDLWRVAYVSARKFFVFHPVLASGPSLDALRLDASVRRRATEGTTFARLDGQLRVLASDGRDNPRGQREHYPVFDLALHEVGRLDAPYPTNIPWPSLVEVDGRRLLITFDGTPAAGDLLGYGTHGDLVVLEQD